VLTGGRFGVIPSAIPCDRDSLGYLSLGKNRQDRPRREGDAAGRIAASSGDSGSPVVNHGLRSAVSHLPLPMRKNGMDGQGDSPPEQSVHDPVSNDRVSW
jgi:hypothetical protein